MMSSSMMPWLGRSTSYVYSVTVVCWMVTNETGLTALVVGRLPLDSRLISNLSEISLIAASSLVLASDNSLELSSNAVSICACLANACLIS